MPLTSLSPRFQVLPQELPFLSICQRSLFRVTPEPETGCAADDGDVSSLGQVWIGGLDESVSWKMLQAPRPRVGSR